MPEQNLQPVPSGAATINPQVYNRPSLTLKSNYRVDTVTECITISCRSTILYEEKPNENNMTPKTTRESIISLEGHITGLKRDVDNIKKNDLQHMHADIDKLGGKIDKVYWVLLATVGAVALQLFNTFIT